MPLYLSILLFIGGLAGVVGGSILLSRYMGPLGRAIGVQDEFLGFLTALGSDSPEITSAVVAMLTGQADVGVGVVFGSNLFNLASLLGLSAVVAGSFAVRRSTVLFNGIVGLAVTIIAALLALNYLLPVVATALTLAIAIAYAAILWMRPEQLRQLPLPESWRGFLVDSAGESQHHHRQVQQAKDQDEEERARKKRKKRSKMGLGSAAWRTGLALIIIITGSTILVKSTSALTSGWLPHGLLGTLVLAALTGIPNLYTSVRLAMRHRGAAVTTEAINSNTLNILVGLMIPSLVFTGIGAESVAEVLDCLYLVGLTAAAVALAFWGRGLNRVQGAAIIAAYLVFVGARVYLSV